MLGLELLLLASAPVDEATPLLNIAAQACTAWVSKSEYRGVSAQEFVDRSGLAEKGLFVTDPVIATSDTSKSTKHFQLGTRSFIRIIAYTAEPKCEFESFGDREFRDGLRAAIKTDDFAKDWSLIGEFGGHRMFAMYDFQPVKTPKVNLHIKAGYFTRPDNNVTFSGTITPISDKPHATSL